MAKTTKMAILVIHGTKHQDRNLETESSVDVYKLKEIDKKKKV